MNEVRPPASPTARVDWIGRIDALLPQTQCQQCGYAACRPYAEAIADGQADINRCPPGGRTNIVRLAELTGLPIRELDPDCGVEGPRQLAWIDPKVCIGCTLCIQACPVDAIIGAPKALHGVLDADCTGCRLCLPPCPVDCIHMEDLPEDTAWTSVAADTARARFAAHQTRLGRVAAGAASRGSAAGPGKPEAPASRRAVEPTVRDPAAAADPTVAADASAPGGTASASAAEPDLAAERRRRLVAAATAKARARLAPAEPPEPR